MFKRSASLATVIIAAVGAAYASGVRAAGEILNRTGASGQDRDPTIRTIGRRRPLAWGNAHQKRAARKRRNVQRNRRAHRRQRGAMSADWVFAIAFLSLLGVAALLMATRPVDDARASMRCVRGTQHAHVEGRDLRLVDEQGRSLRCFT